MRRLLVPLVVALALLGCSDSSSDDGGGADGTDATVADVTGTTGSTTETTADDTGPEVDVVNAGAEPRTQLRLAFTPGTTLTFRSSTSVDQTVAGASPGPITTTYDITTEVQSVDDGIAQLRVTYAGVDVDTGPAADPDVVSGAEQTADILEGAVADLQVDDHGRIVDAGFTPGPDSSDLGETVLQSLVDSLTKLAIVLPDEAVGVGGQWLQHATIDAGGTVTTTDQTFTIDAIDDAGVDLSFVLTGTITGGAEGTTNGSGTVRVWFDSYFPDTDATTSNAVDAQGSAVTQDITQSVHRS